MCDEYNFEKKNALKRGVEIYQSGSGDWDVSKSESELLSTDTDVQFF